MRIAVVGAGFVGVATGLFFCERGHRVTLVERAEARRGALEAGRAPFHEPGVAARLRRVLASRRLRVASSLSRRESFEAYVVAVGTPARRDGAADLAQVKRAAAQIGRHARRARGRPLVLVKSTVPPGTLEEVVIPRVEAGSGRREGRAFFAVSNPEFLREGSAIEDTFRPSRVVVGSLTPTGRRRAAKLFEGLRCPVLETDPRTAEFVKLASNLFLALKVSYANEVARVAAALGVDVYEAMRGVGLDPRVGLQFLRAGAGFGGSCLPKDVRAYAALARRRGRPSRLAEAVLTLNEEQPIHLVNLVERALGSLRRKRVALLGVAFKPGTSDVRETRALPIWRELRRRGARVVVWDPRATKEFQALAGDAVDAARTLGDALRGADCAVVQTEWRQVAALRPGQLRRWMRRPIVVDGRRTFDPASLERAGVRYYALGWRREPGPRKA